MSSSLVTMGFGPAPSGLVVRGFESSTPSFVVEAIEEIVRPIRVRSGRSGRRLHDLDEVIVWAKLVEAAGRAPSREVKGSVASRVNEGKKASIVVEHVVSHAHRVWGAITVTAQRFKRDK